MYREGRCTNKSNMINRNARVTNCFWRSGDSLQASPSNNQLEGPGWGLTRLINAHTFAGPESGKLMGYTLAHSGPVPVSQCCHYYHSSPVFQASPTFQSSSFVLPSNNNWHAFDEDVLHVWTPTWFQSFRPSHVSHASRTSQQLAFLHCIACSLNWTLIPIAKRVREFPPVPLCLELVYFFPIFRFEHTNRLFLRCHQSFLYLFLWSWMWISHNTI